MKELVYKILGRILPKRLLRKWLEYPVGTFQWDVCDYAPIRRGIL